MDLTFKEETETMHLVHLAYDPINYAFVNFHPSALSSQGDLTLNNWKWAN